VVTSQLCYTAPHGNKETKLSHLNSQESFGISINFTADEKGCVKGIQSNAKIRGGKKESRPPQTPEKA